MNSSVSIKLGQRIKDNGEVSVNLFIIRNRRNSSIQTGYYTLPANWNKAKGIYKSHKEKALVNTRLTALLSRAQEILLKIDVEHPNISVKEVAQILRERLSGREISGGFYEFAEVFVNGTEEKEHKDRIPNFYTRDHYNTSLAILRQYKAELNFPDIDYAFCVKFERWARDRGIMDNTLRGYFRDIRSLFNKAIKSGVCPKELYPFGTWGYSIPPEAETRHTAMADEPFEKLETAALSGFEAVARDTFMLQYYLMGARIGAVMRLEHKNITGSQIKYTAGKRKKIHEFTITKKALEIIDRYRGGRFLLPLFDEWPSPEDAKKKNREINDALEAVCKSLDIPKVTTHQARHTFSKRMLQEDVHPLKMRDALGHSDVKTTQIYTGKLTTSEMDSVADTVYGKDQ